ncbi:hypothetical protein KP509_11G053300 [Ceratopteris richardii]|nr:hypothetical protein KP509_11G053300 [Ceratopteris richardii]
MWSKDEFYSGGSAANASVRSGVTPVELMTLRYFQITDGPENCYNVTVPNGHYVIRLYFAYGQFDNSNKEPLFDISLEGTLVHSLKQGWSSTPDLSYAEFRAFISDGAATICFHSTGHGNPSVLSIEVLQILNDAYDIGQKSTILKTVQRVSCGSKDSKFGVEYSANAWGGDRFWATDKDLDMGLSRTITTTRSVQHASDAPNLVPEAVFQSASETPVGSPLTYFLDVEPNQNYSIWFYFAEIDPAITGKEQRVFDILVNNIPIFSEFDIIGKAGRPFTGVTLKSFLPIDGKVLTLRFDPRQGGILINGFEIFQVIQTEFTTMETEVWALQTMKKSLGLPPRLGWNGDPCVPQVHPWNGVDCHFDNEKGTWIIDGLDLDNQGIKGFLSNDMALLQNLQSLNLSGNSISGSIPSNVGKLSNLVVLDLSFNQLNGSIPESLGSLTHLRKLFLNSNLLSGEVPTVLGAGPIHGASFNFSDNPGLCGIPGLRSCSGALAKGSITAIVVTIILVVFIGGLCGFVIYKRRQNIARAQKLSTAREAPYAKSRTGNAALKDLQMVKPPGRERYVPHYMQHT